MTSVRSGAVLLAAMAASASAETPAPAAARIVAGPNILVSRDGDVAHCETMIAANPRDPKNLLGGSIVMAMPDGGATNKGYVSADGGSTWKALSFEEGEKGGGDPQVGFGASGTAYFMGISLANGIYLSRSEDGGKTWEAPRVIGKGDHEMLITDTTNGPFAGRVYLTLETSGPGSDEIDDLMRRSRVVLYRSSDDGRTFTGPVLVAPGEGRGLAAYNPLVLSDGTLFVPMMEYPNYATEKDVKTWKAVFSLSKDGGVSFSPKQPIGEVLFGGVSAMREQQKSARVDGITGPVFGIDRSGKFPDRLYAAWSALEGSRLRLFLTHSSDRGATWSAPEPVDAGAPADASEYLAMIAANPDGVLGVFYYSTESFPKRDRSHVYFTASLDGGETFLPKVRLSNEASRPFGAGNLRPGPFVSKDRGMVLVDTISGLSAWKNGGDYIGMTAASDGVFHPFWSDARTGTYQLYTSAIRVQTDPPLAMPAGLREASLVETVTLVFDPIQYDAARREVAMPVRLKNISQERLYPPFVVEIKELEAPYMVKAGWKGNPPKFLNASNGKPGVGATYDYAKALGGLDALEPEAVTDAIVWRLQADSPVKTDFHIGTEIRGFVDPKGGKK